MSDIDNSKAFYGLTMKSKLRFEEERVAKIREREKRKRKEKLYSYNSISH